MLNAATAGELPLVVHAFKNMSKSKRLAILKNTLQVAIEMGHIDIVKFLADNGAVIKRKYIEEFAEDNSKMKEYLESKI